MMKKFFYMSVLVLMAALTMTSCGSDDDKKDEPYEPGGGGGSGSGSKTAVYDFTTNISQDLLDICDITMVYKDGDGKTVREAAKSTQFKKTVNVKKFPAVVGAKCEVKLKDGVQLTKDKYDLIATYDHQLAVSGKSPVGTKENTFIQSKGLNKDKVADFISRHNGTQCYGFTIDANGAANTTQNITF